MAEKLKRVGVVGKKLQPRTGGKTFPPLEGRSLESDAVPEHRAGPPGPQSTCTSQPSSLPAQGNPVSPLSQRGSVVCGTRVGTTKFQ